ncbi:MAG: 50S ribosomal protein L29 [Bacteroidota bacterium]
MKPFDLRKLSNPELLKRIQEEQENLSNLKFQKVIGQLENPLKLGQIKKDIARMNTILREREINPQPVAPAPAENAK